MRQTSLIVTIRQTITQLRDDATMQVGGAKMRADKLLEWLSSPVVTLGGAKLSILSLAKGLVLVICLHFVAKWIGGLTQRW
ncbi:MAG: hypothetical protein ACK40X_11760, partial [Armatimonadota bacterium]